MSKKHKQKNTNKTAAPETDRSGFMIKLCDFLIFIFLAATIFMIPLFFNILTFDQFELPKLTMLRVLTAVTLGLWLIKTVMNGRFEYRPSPLDIPMLLWAAMNVITTFTSFAPELSFRGEYENFAGSLSNINYVVLYFIASQNLRTRGQIYTINAALLSAGLFITIYAIAQYFGHDFIKWSEGSMIKGRYFSTMGNPNFLGALLTMIIPLNAAFFISSLKKISENNTLHSRPVVIIVSAYTLAVALSVAFLINNLHPAKMDISLAMAVFFMFFFCALTYAAYAFIKNTVKNHGTGIKTGIFSVLFTGILLLLFIFSFISLLGTQSRGPVLAFIAAGIFFTVVILREKIKSTGKQFSSLAVSFVSNKRAVIIALVIIGVLCVLCANFGKAGIQRLLNSAAHPVESFKKSRGHIWEPAIRIAVENPLLGTGVDTFKTVFPRYEGIEFSQIDGANVSSRTAHNELLNIAATMGLVSLGIYILLIFTYTRMWVRSYRREDDFHMKLLSLAMFTGFIAYFVQNIFSFGVAAINTVFYLFMAMHAFLYTRSFGNKIKIIRFYNSRSAAAPAIKLVLCACIIAGVYFLSALAVSVYGADMHYNRGKLFSMQSDNFKINKKMNEAIQYAQASIQEHVESVRLAPSEVKYNVYAGLSYEKFAMLLPDSEKETIKMAVKAAIDGYLAGVRLNPGNAYYWGNLGRIYAFRAQHEDPKYIQKSVEFYRKAVEMAPVTGLFYNNLIDIYIRSGMPEPAKELFETLKKIDTKQAANTAFLAGTALFQSGKPKEAREYFYESVLLKPDFARAHYNLGISAASIGDARTAKKHLEKYIELEPGADMSSHARSILESIKPAE